MEEKTTVIKSLFQKIEIYIKTEISLLRLKAINELTKIVSTILSSILIAIIGILIFILINIGVALWIGELVNKTYQGFFIIAAFYVLMLLILYFINKNFIKQAATSYILKKLSKKD